MVICVEEKGGEVHGYFVPLGQGGNVKCSN